MPDALAGKRVLVTGASSGIGAATAPGLVRTGAFRGIDHAGVRDAYAAMPFDFLHPDDVAAAILSAVSARPGACADLIELRPIGQP